MSTPEEQLRQLDQRAAGAAADLHDRAAARPIPTFDPDQVALTPLTAGRPSGRGRVLAVAAVVLVLAAVAGVLVAQIGDGGDDTDPAKVITTEPRPYVVADLPAGFSLAGAGEVTGGMRRSSEGETASTGPLTMYGPSAEDPQLGVAVMPGWDESATEADGVEEVEVGDRTAYRYDNLGLGKRALLVPDGDRAIFVVSSTMERARIEELAAEVRADESGTVDLGGFDLPDGWREVGTIPDLLGSANPLMATANASAVGKYLMYERGSGQTVEATDSSDGSDRSDPTGDDGTGQGAPDPLLPDPGMLLVSVTQGDTVDLQSAALLSDTATRTTIRGHDALITTSGLSTGDDAPLQQLRSVTWLERPGELIRVSGTGLDEGELVAAATSLKAVGPAKWKDLIERSQLGEFDPANAGDPPRVKVGDGRFPDGTRWLLAATPSDDPDFPTPSVDLSVSLSSSGDSSSSSSGTGSGDGSSPVEPIVATQLVDTGGQRFLGALVGPDVIRVELRDAGGQVIAEPEVIEGGGYRGFATVAPADAVVAVAFADDGTELGRSPLDLGDAAEEEGTGDTTATTMSNSEYEANAEPDPGASPDGSSGSSSPESGSASSGN